MNHDQGHSVPGVPIQAAPGGLPPPPVFRYREQGLRRVRRATNWIIAFVLVAVGATSAELGHLANATRAVGARPPLRRQLVRWRSPEVRPQAQPLRRCRRPQRSMPRPPFRGVRSMAAADNTVTAGWQVSGLPEPFRAAERAAIGTTARVVVWPAVSTGACLGYHRRRARPSGPGSEQVPTPAPRCPG